MMHSGSHNDHRLLSSVSTSLLFPFPLQISLSPSLPLSPPIHPFSSYPSAIIPTQLLADLALSIYGPGLTPALGSPGRQAAEAEMNPPLPTTPHEPHSPVVPLCLPHMPVVHSQCWPAVRNLSLHCGSRWRINKTISAAGAKVTYWGKNMSNN